MPSEREERNAARGPGELRAFSRPAAIVIVALVRGLSGWLLARPLSSIIAGSGIGQRAEGDAALFADGGLLLLDVLRQRGADLSALAGGLMPLSLALLGLAQLANAALWVGLNTSGPLSAASWLRRALSHTPTLMAFAFLSTLLQALLIISVASGAGALTADPRREVAYDAALAAVALITLLGLGLVSAVGDLAKAARVRHRSSFSGALAGAWFAVRARPWRGLLGYVPYAAAALALVAAGAALVSAVDVSNPGASRWLLVGLIHQLVILGLVLLRAAWFASALELVASARGRRLEG